MACTERVVVPLKAMCSRTWLMPLVAGVSSREPTCRNTPTLTLRTWGMGRASSLAPLGSVRRIGVVVSMRYCRCGPLIAAQLGDQPCQRLVRLGATQAQLGQIAACNGLAELVDLHQQAAQGFRAMVISHQRCQHLHQVSPPPRPLARDV